MISNQEKISISGSIISIFLFLLPFIYSRDLFYAAVNAKQFFFFGVVYVLVSVFIYRFWNRPLPVGLLKTKLFWALVAFLLVYSISGFLGVFPELSFGSQVLRSTGILFLSHLVVFGVILALLLNRQDWNLVRRSIVVSSAIFSGFYMLGMQGLGLSGRFLGINLSVNGLTLGNETFAGAYVCLAIILTLVEIANSTRATPRRWFFVALIFQLFSPLIFNFRLFQGGVAFPLTFQSLLGVALASSVVSWSILIFSGIHYIISRLFKDKKIQKITQVAHAGVWFVGILIAITLLFVPGSFVQNKYIETSTAARIIVWESAWENIKKRPLLGSGPETFPVIFPHTFNNDLYLQKNIGEIWFDRAHNYFVDTLVSTGFFGLLASLMLFIFTARAFLLSRRRGDISKPEGLLLLIFLIAYIVQLQTSFETVTSHILLVVILAYALNLELSMCADKSIADKKNIGFILQRIILGILLVGAILGIKNVLLKERNRQLAVVNIFRTQAMDFEKREKLMYVAFGRVADFESLRNASAGYTSGLIEVLPKSDSIYIEKSIQELNLYEYYYTRYLQQAPNDYRARMNLAYIYLLKTILGNNSIDKAKKLIEDSYVLSKNNPLTYMMDALAHLYAGELGRARELAYSGVLLNPDITFSQKVFDHIEKQAKTFPEISFLPLGNL